MPQDDALVTRETLLLRLREPEDDAAWAEFVEIYTPLLFNYCRKREINHTDISDIVQEVMRSVSLAIQNFQYDPEKGRFRGWLFTAVRNAVSRHFSKSAKRPVPASSQRMAELLDETPDTDEVDRWERDYQKQLIIWAIGKIRPAFSERIWKAFEETAIHGRSVAEVSEELEMSKNAVMIAKHRVTKALKEKTLSVDAGEWEAELIGFPEKN